jgi:sugar lactone lactonase YvrE
MATSSEATRLLRPGLGPQCTLAEGPVWDHRQNCLWWVDIPRPAIHRWNATNNEITTFSKFPLTAAPFLSLAGSKKDGGERVARFVSFAIPTTTESILVCGCEYGLFLFDTLTQKSTLVAEMPQPAADEGSSARKGPPRLRFNDAKVDAHGRLFAGTMDMTEKQPIGGLFLATWLSVASPSSSSATNSALCRVRDVGDVTVSNGMDWCPCTKRMYYIDSPSQQVRFYKFSHESGLVSEAVDEIDTPQKETVDQFPKGSNGTGRVLAQLVNDWFPDGMCVDESGFLWVAVWNGGRVLRIDPSSGAVCGEVRVPVKRVTSVCFGGPRLSQLYITTAKGNDVSAAPDAGEEETAGHIFVASVGVCGTPFTPFALQPAQRM